jgi:hypothetical protein
MKRSLVIVVALLFFSQELNAQQTWLEFGVSKEIIKNLEVNLTPQVRFREGFGVKAYMVDAGVEYNFSKYFDAGAFYRLENTVSKKGKTSTYGRFAFDLGAKYKLKRFEPSVRLRYTNDDDFNNEDNSTPKCLRYKFGLDYTFKKTGLNPYILYELYQNLSEKEFDKSRFETGIFYKFNKQNRLGAYYRRNRNLSENKSANIIGIVYKLKL